jgi:glutamine synthetase
MTGENVLPPNLVNDEVASFSRWTGLEPESLSDIMRHYQDPGSPHHAAAAECLHRIVENIKAYCVGRGVTKFCHWFNSWTESPAYKRDNIAHLSTETLFQGEPDASSKPSGGLRSTYEARGYTVWDSKAPLFILNGTTLCIPTLFISYYGEALDLKSPTLRAKTALSKSVRRFLDLALPGRFDWSTQVVRTFAGPEQEYFLVPAELVAERPDMVHCSTLLMGNPPPRNQQLSEHYLGSIPVDVHAFFEELNAELARLGITPSTDHNEVAPRQFEFAPMFAEATRAADQNLLAMHLLREVAERHGWVAFTHEKPFPGINGSGKHLNFSVGIVDRVSERLVLNLHAPPRDPDLRFLFLVSIAATVMGIKRRARLLRGSVASRSNDMRLGGHEAPPAIISAYMGETIGRVAGQLFGLDPEKNGGSVSSRLDLALDGVPLVSRDHTDRNRTSPLAFTGNKFEFRMPGANSATYLPLTMIIAAMAEGFGKAADIFEALGAHRSREAVLLEVFQNLMKEAEEIVFNGDCYSQQWRDEAARRGLPNATHTAEALEAFNDPEQQEFLSGLGIWSRQECSAFFRVKMDEYAKRVAIEAVTMLEMVTTGLRPAAIEHQTTLAERVTALGDALEIAEDRGLTAPPRPRKKRPDPRLGAAGLQVAEDPGLAQARALAQQLDDAVRDLGGFGELITRLDRSVDRVNGALRALEREPDDGARGRLAAADAVPALHALRAVCNDLERQLPADLYPFPTCGELLYEG